MSSRTALAPATSRRRAGGGVGGLPCNPAGFPSRRNLDFRDKDNKVKC